VVSYSALVIAVIAAFIAGVLVSRGRLGSQVVWEDRVARDASHDTAAADPEVQRHLAQGQLIAAIKRYRTLTGAGLKEAKDAVEALQRQRVAGETGDSRSGT
jgi:ribosomal protein L7/L12